MQSRPRAPEAQARRTRGAGEQRSQAAASHARVGAADAVHEHRSGDFVYISPPLAREALAPEPRPSLGVSQSLPALGGKARGVVKAYGTAGIAASPTVVDPAAAKRRANFGGGRVAPLRQVPEMPSMPPLPSRAAKGAAEKDPTYRSPLITLEVDLNTALAGDQISPTDSRCAACFRALKGLLEAVAAPFRPLLHTLMRELWVSVYDPRLRVARFEEQVRLKVLISTRDAELSVALAVGAPVLVAPARRGASLHDRPLPSIDQRPCDVLIHLFSALARDRCVSTGARPRARTHALPPSRSHHPPTTRSLVTPVLLTGRESRRRLLPLLSTQHGGPRIDGDAAQGRGVGAGAEATEEPGGLGGGLSAATRCAHAEKSFRRGCSAQVCRGWTPRSTRRPPGGSRCAGTRLPTRCPRVRACAPRSSSFARSRVALCCAAEMKVTHEEMKAARVPLLFRDYCAHILIPLNACRVKTWYSPFQCTELRHSYEKCQYEEFERRVKIAEIDAKREAAGE